MWGGCTQAYAAFAEKWATLLNEDMSNDDIRDLGFNHWKWGNHAPRKLMVETAIVGEYFHIYRYVKSIVYVHFLLRVSYLPLC